jgi:long-subunit fatty acid transport protein
LWSGSYFAGSLQYEDGWSGLNDWLSAAAPSCSTAGSNRRRRSTTSSTAARTAASSSPTRNWDAWTANLNYDDTWGFALGGRYTFADGWLWSVGGGFDTSPMSKDERSPKVPLDEQYRLVTGLQYSFNERITLGAAYQYMNAGDADLDVERGRLAGRLQGDYEASRTKPLWFDPGSLRSSGVLANLLPFGCPPTN